MSDNEMASPSERDDAITGALAAGMGYSLWGLSIVFYKQLTHVPPFEVLAHRSVWSVLLTIVVVLALRRSDRLIALLRNRKSMLTLTCTALLIGSNWFVFILSINQARVLETSLGYYINPLVSVLLGVLFLGEKLSRPQMAAVGFALLGVINFAVVIGTLPWISLYLAFSFAAYGYLRKVSRIEPLEGLFVEVSLLLPLAIAYLGWLHAHGGMYLETSGWYETTFLILTGPMTTVPLILFVYGAQRIRLATLGLMQYLAPTAQFLIAVNVYGEPIKPMQLITFALIWLALAIFSFDTWRKERELRRLVV